MASAPVKVLPSLSHPFDAKVHHAEKGFTNPWPSAGEALTMLQAAKVAWDKPTAVPVPEEQKNRPVQVVKPNFDAGSKDQLRATWIGHASWLLRFPSSTDRGITVLADPLFSDRTSPVSFFGPKRYSPTPCKVADLPHIDVVVISHNHYDHLDINALKALWQKQQSSSSPLRFFVPLNLRAWILSNLSGIPEDDVFELDWWEGRSIDELEIYATPAQHGSKRTATDGNASLWASWTFRSTVRGKETTCFFAGDTGYRVVPPSHATPIKPPSPFPGDEQSSSLPCNPVFAHIGQLFNGFDLALLPIGLFNPISFMSSVHASPWDSVDMSHDLQARKSIAMHFGTVRGGLSANYEPIDLPLKELKAACERKGIAFGKVDEVGESEGAFLFCDIGQTVCVEGRGAADVQ